VTPAPRFGGPWQVAFVVPSLENALRVWWDEYGVGPWRVWNLTAERLSQQQVDGEGRRYGMRIAIARWDPVEVELIEPLDDASIYARSLAEHMGRAHVHHLHVSTTDYDDALEAMRRRGAGPAMSGGLNGSRFCYLATESDLGTMLEMGATPPDWDFPEPDATYPPDAGHLGSS
jgi:hypothetical protein